MELVSLEIKIKACWEEELVLAERASVLSFGLIYGQVRARQNNNMK